jgi:hypothetical protein
MKKFKNCLLSLPRTGSNWVRYWFEYFSNENTSERNILVEINHRGETRTEKTNATLYKRHKLSKEDIESRDIQKLVCVLRDYRECFVRHCRGRTFDKKVSRMSDYTDNLYVYDAFAGDKMIMYYEDFVSDPKTYMKQVLDFLEVRSNWDDIDVKEHRDISVKLYEAGGSDKVGSQTRGAPSLTKGKSDFQFHQSELNDETKQQLETWFRESHPSLHDEYLVRYKLGVTGA